MFKKIHKEQTYHDFSIYVNKLHEIYDNQALDIKEPGYE